MQKKLILGTLLAALAFGSAAADARPFTTIIASLILLALSIICILPVAPIVARGDWLSSNLNGQTDSARWLRGLPLKTASLTGSPTRL